VDGEQGVDAVGGLRQGEAVEGHFGAPEALVVLEPLLPLP